MFDFGLGCSPDWVCDGISYGFGLLGLGLLGWLAWSIWRSR